ncbi:MAG: c-type cytochrome [Rhodocyclaceae bacterium]|nr:c-type cytochrome [Rhodocyclaceae bacterium]
MSLVKLPSRSRGSASILVLTILILALLGVAALMARAPSAPRAADPDVAAEQTATAIAPVARVEMAKAAVDTGPKTGEQIVTAICGACHGTGAAGAPKIGDKAAWAPRLALGLDGLVKSATAGKNAMPPKGGNPNLSSLDLARAIVFMANKSGASFKEPAEKK